MGVDEELRLALVRNPLGAGAADDAAGGDAAAGGKDNRQRAFADPDEFWSEYAADAGGGGEGEGGSRAAWYGRSAAYWGGVSADINGMLGGLQEVHAVDAEASLAFIDELRGGNASAAPLADGCALDCGAGIGRVSNSVLLQRFSSVELLEPSAAFLATAAKTLDASRVRASHQLALQDFTPAAGAAYALVWVQWVLNYLTDDDLVAFLRRCAAALGGAGACVVVKESVAKPGSGFYADHADASITRTDAHFRALFGRAGLAVAAERTQPGMPRGVFEVRMYALRSS